MEIDSLKNEITTLKNQVENSANNFEKLMLYDLRESEKRKNNLMVFGLPESDSTSDSERKMEDITLIRKAWGIRF